MNKKLKIAGFITLLSFTSCSGDRVFEEFYGFEQEKWVITDTAKFELSLPASEDLLPLIAVRYNETYPFSNLYVRMETKDSSGVVLENKLLNVPIFETKSGQPMGKGFGNSFTKYDTLPISFDPKVKTVSLVQYMRQESVDGLEAIGLKILKK